MPIGSPNSSRPEFGSPKQGSIQFPLLSVRPPVRFSKNSRTNSVTCDVSFRHRDTSIWIMEVFKIK